jgi:predicted ThiF/HesA family dinucleotide-utilizing enzyme
MHDSIHLRDWSNNLTGIDQVIELSANTFKKYPKATIELCNIAKFSENKIVAQIEIHLDANEKLEVIDIFEITNNKIINLTAYKI